MKSQEFFGSSVHGTNDCLLCFFANYHAIKLNPDTNSIFWSQIVPTGNAIHYRELHASKTSYEIRKISRARDTATRSCLFESQLPTGIKNVGKSSWLGKNVANMGRKYHQFKGSFKQTKQVSAKSPRLCV